jgi:hypothetical protein
MRILAGFRSTPNSGKRVAPKVDDHNGTIISGACAISEAKERQKEQDIEDESKEASADVLAYSVARQRHQLIGLLGCYMVLDGDTWVFIWVCLKIGYIPNYSHLIGIMIINHWV